MLIQSKETNPVKGDKSSQWRQNQLNRFLKIFLRPIQSMETKPVKSIPKDFSGGQFSQWRQNQLNRFLKIFLMRTQSMETKPVKSTPKDFSDVDPVEEIPRPRLIQLNQFLKIFLRRSQSMETKSIPKDFSEAKPFNGDKIS